MLNIYILLYIVIILYYYYTFNNLKKLLNKKNIEHFSNDNNICINLLRKREQLNREIESYECNHFINKRNYFIKIRICIF